MLLLAHADSYHSASGEIEYPLSLSGYQRHGTGEPLQPRRESLHCAWHFTLLRQGLSNSPLSWSATSTCRWSRTLGGRLCDSEIRRAERFCQSMGPASSHSGADVSPKGSTSCFQSTHPTTSSGTQRHSLLRVGCSTHVKSPSCRFYLADTSAALLWQCARFVLPAVTA